MKNSKCICPYCGAPAKFERPFNRIVTFLFWTFEAPAHAWYATCSGYCEDFDGTFERYRGRTLAEARRNWRKWYDTETAGLPDIPILAYAKYGKDVLHGK